MKILIIIPYFGNCPDWIDYFLQSCKYNPSVSWLIFSDINKPDHCPSNVLFVYKSLSDFNYLASIRLNLDIQIFNPYKICDLRPAFGEIFKDYLTGFDFWGYSDIDLIYGDIRSFINNSILENFEIISSREDYLAGHFTLFKNSGKTNLLFQKCKNYREIFENNNLHFAFDERSNLTGRKLYRTKKSGFARYFFSAGDKIMRKMKMMFNNKKYANMQDMTQIVEMSAKNGELKLYKKNMVRSDLWFLKEGIRNWQIIWDSGKLTDTSNKMEILHFHIIKLKHHGSFKIGTIIPDQKFKITLGGINIIP